MSTNLAWLLRLPLILAAMVVQVHGLSPPGFLSLDCGLANKSAYNDSITGLLYISDSGFVEGGLSYQISANLMDQATNEQEKTLRSFPGGQRNCYTLPSIPGKRYLLRTTFTYGNYDGLNKTEDGSLFLFGLHIGVNLWATVNLTNSGNSTNTFWKEVLTVAPDRFISVCLINFGLGTPFVSSLEMRRIGDSMYPFVNSSVSASYFSRLRFGAVDEFISRYPMDSYDRFWERFDNWSYPWVNLTSKNKAMSSPPANHCDDFSFSVPSAILQRASTIESNFSWFSITVEANSNLQSETMELIPIFHFAEVGDVNGGARRTFDLSVDDEQLLHNFTLPATSPVTKFDSSTRRRGSRARIVLRRSPGSDLPPLINALELHSRVWMINLTTASGDVDSMESIKEKYMVTRNWNGDPCSPRDYTWDGLNCIYPNGHQNPRVVELNLSASGLRGEIATSFMSMSSLEKLDLSNNNLTGTVPDYRLYSLRVLNLSNNQLIGPIPDSVLQRIVAGQLDLRFGML
ncbi:hypothetical protein ABZP36_016365 [Zizania latifolia]